MALLKTNTGIGTTNPTSALHVIGDVLVTGVVTVPLRLVEILMLVLLQSPLWTALTRR